MVIKTCKICGEPFDARGTAKCCSPECSKENKRRITKEWHKNNLEKEREYKKEYRENHRDEICEYNKEYYKANRDELLEYNKEYRENHRDELLEYSKEYYKVNRDEFLKKRKEYTLKKIAELNEKFDGNLESILNECPHIWEEREAIMQVEFGVSYVEAMYQKIESNPVCEVTGSKNNLVIHHLDSFNLHPEKGANQDNLVRITKEIHDEFHSIYGYGNNTCEQWNEFVENLDIKRGDLI